MRTYPKKRIDITVETPLLKRVTALLDAQGVTGYTVLPALAGRGADGTWDSSGLVGGAGGIVLIYCIVDPARIDAVLEPLFTLVSGQIGIVTVSDVEVVRPEHF